MTLDERPYVPVVGDVSNEAVALVAIDDERFNVWRGLLGVLLVAVLITAIFTQRTTISGAFAQIGHLSGAALVALGALTVYERWSRADIVRRLLGEPVGLGRACTIHDVGSAVSKGIPLGGALGTAARWSITRDSGVGPRRFATMLMAYGLATTFATWSLPLVAILADLTQRPPGVTDLVLVGVILVVLIGSAAFWTVVLRSQRLETWAVGRMRRIVTRLAGRVSTLDGKDPAGCLGDIRSDLRDIARRPFGLLGRTLLAQACGALILYVALRSLGVGPELGLTEFFRVFFVVHLAGTFAPTPGGVGVVEAGATGALIAAGVEPTTALAGVLVYRLLTYVVPIVFGAVLYVVWRVRGVRSEPTRMVGHGASFDTAIPHLPCASHQGFRQRRHAG